MQQFTPGYAMHVIHARRLAVTPWGWRPGLVGSISDDGRTVTVSYLQQDGLVTVWHHAPIVDLELGLPVRVHEQYHALEVGTTWFNVAVRRGIGQVPEPDDLELWNDESSVQVLMDLRTGNAVRKDPPDWF